MLSANNETAVHKRKCNNEIDLNIYVNFKAPVGLPEFLQAEGRSITQSPCLKSLTRVRNVSQYRQHTESEA